MIAIHSADVHLCAVSPFFVCNKRRGAPRKKWPTVAWAQCAEQPAPTEGVSSTRQVSFNLLCGVCTTKIQIRTACENWETCFTCRVHGEAKPLSGLQLKCLEEISSIEGIGRIAVEQYCALDLAQKAVDFVLLDYDIMVEADGSQHGIDSTGFDKPAGKQFGRDREFDRAVKAAGRRLVRLHWGDGGHWCKTVRTAIRRVQRQPGCAVLLYSPSYPEWCRV